MAFKSKQLEGVTPSNHKMFPSSSKSTCSSNPFSSYTFETSFAGDENPNISGPVEQTGSSFLHFPSPFLCTDDELLENHIYSQQQLLASTQAVAEAEIEQPRSEVVSKKKQTQTQRRTTGKKDRHSKIYTAQGPRDRRMRLSLQIARKFFDLQDMLGFDKASKTIEWLFTASKDAVKELMGSLPQVKRTGYVSESEGSVSEIKQTSNIIGDHKEGLMGKGVKQERKSRNPAFRPLSKDCRDKARARARERTREKMVSRKLEKSKQCFEANPNNLEQVTPGFSSPYDLFEESSSPSQDMNSPLKAANEVEKPAVVTHLIEHQMATVGIMDKFLGMETSALTSPSILNYSYNNTAESSDGIYSSGDFLGVQGGWGMENARIQSNYCASAVPDHIDPTSTGDVYLQPQSLGN